MRQSREARMVFAPDCKKISTRSYSVCVASLVSTAHQRKHSDSLHRHQAVMLLSTLPPPCCPCVCRAKHSTCHAHQHHRPCVGTSLVSSAAGRDGGLCHRPWSRCS